MERPAKYNPDAKRLAPGEYRLDATGKSVMFRLPKDMDPDERLHSVPVGGGAAWILVNLDPITITPSIWYNRGGGEAGGEWHGFLTDGKFIQV